MSAGSVPAESEQPCIRCGDCATVCPERLNPQHLLLQLRDGRLGEAASEGVPDCTECGRCEIACPSRIPLVQRYREAKAAIGAMNARQELAMDARSRYRARQQRLARDEEQRTARHAGHDADHASADAVAAAIARAQARRAARKDPGA
jgi:electron transport complex protein RnfC